MNEPVRVLYDPTATSAPSASSTQPVTPGHQPERGGDCPHCGGNKPASAMSAIRGWVYAVGRILPQFPDLGVEKEFAQLAGGPAGAGGMLETDQLREVLKDPENAYLARQLCWVFYAGELEAFTIVARDDTETRRLVDSLPAGEQADQTVQVVIGAVGSPIPGMPCSAGGLPSVWVDHHLTFPLNQFLGALPAQDQGGGKSREEKAARTDDKFRAAARDVFLRMTRRSDNRGFSDEHRAMNYVALRYPPLYRLVADAYTDEKVLLGVEARRAPSASRLLVAVRVAFRSRRMDLLERYQCLVDVTDRFPFLATPLSAVYD